MIIPYKVKNPPQHFPAITVGIIAANLLVYVLTAERGVMIRHDVVDAWAVRWGESALYTIFTAMFLHAGPLHLAGNMLFLWIFGQAVEDRLRPGLYLVLYLASGFAGFVLHAAFSVALGSVPALGASGCIMGVMGAYWYLYSFSPVCVFYWFGFFVIGTFEIAACWVIGSYLVLDLINGMLARYQGLVGGVANFAHVGGAVAGIALVWGLRIRRDSSDLSQIKANHADCGDKSLLSCAELAALLQDSPDSAEVLLAYAKRAWECAEAPHLQAATGHDPRAVISALPDAAADLLLVLNGEPRAFLPGDLVYLARHCEQIGQPLKAVRLYEMLGAAHPNSPELEIALYREAAICLHHLRDVGGACGKLRKLLAWFPNGALALESEDLLKSLEGQGYKAA